MDVSALLFFSSLLPQDVARQRQSVEPRAGRPLAQALLRAWVAKWVGGACANSFREGRVKRDGGRARARERAKETGREGGREGGEDGMVAESLLSKLQDIENGTSPHGG